MNIYKHNGDLTKAASETINRMIDLKREIDKLTVSYKEEQNNFKTAMEDSELKTVKIPALVDITYVAATTQMKFDSTAFKAEHPDLYKKFQKESSVSASLRMTMK